MYVASDCLFVRGCRIISAMRVVAWNIRAGGGRRVEAIGAQLARWSPDVVALSEFRATRPSQALARALAQRGFRHQETTADLCRPGVNTLVAASRWPLRRLRADNSPREPGRWLLVVVEAPEPFALGAMHVPNRASGRKDTFLAGVLRVARAWRDGPAVLVGDTNSGRIGLDEARPVFNDNEDRWLRALDACGWTDAFRCLHPRARAYTWYSPNAGNGFRIDQGFVNAALLPRLRAARYAWGRMRASVATAGSLTQHAPVHRLLALKARAVLSDHAAFLLDFVDGRTVTGC